ncbi:unnamed protein product [Rodentolepis nana]|uniref:Bestrophin homolog n=1 Tax=Rodentolepis nana TaxID=102285 RepID=A0A0R3TCG5_RODNA|nr:unnamed protein product [Rodentolepis nana]
MSIPYSWKIATNKRTAFLQLLMRWKGTIYKYILHDFCTFLLVYGLISVTYRYLMSDQSRRLVYLNVNLGLFDALCFVHRYFEYYCQYCAGYGHLIPVGLVVGFFVDVVVKRWWGQFQTIPWPDEIALLLSAYIPDDSVLTKQKMKTFMRYINLANTITLRLFCSRIKKRYAVDQILLADGMMTPSELKRLQNSAPSRKAAFYAAPLYWAGELVLEMRDSGLIMSDRAVELLYKGIAVIRAKGAKLIIYNMIINVPLGFTQVATITIYVYVIASTFSCQFLDTTQGYKRKLVDLYIPIFGMLRLIFFLGWIKVAEALINPFGEDPDDFAMDEYNERDVQVCILLLVVD